MARWKANSDGTGYYDPNDSGPDQYKPTAEESARYTPPRPPQTNPYPPPATQTQGQGETTTPGQTNDTGGITGQGQVAYQPPTQAPQGGWQYMEGINTNKLNDFSHTTPKYQAARILASGGSLQDAAQAIGAQVLDQDKLRLPDGTIVDTRRDIEGANQLQWTVTYDPNDPNWGQPAPPPAGSNGSSAAGGQSFGLGSANGAANGLWGLLMQRAMQGTNINPNDPNISPAVNAYRAEQERGARNYISDQAEAQGPLANLSGERRIANEHAAQSTGQMQSQLILNELNSRRQEIQQALAQMGSLLSDQQKIELQAELGRLEAAARQQQITNQNNQFLDEFGLNVTDRANYWDALRNGQITG